MIASRYLLNYSRRALIARTVALSTRTAPSLYDPIEQLVDPNGLDILNSPEVRQILAKQQQKQKAEMTTDNKLLPKQSLLQRNPSLFYLANDDGYDSDCEPMHDNWENEMDDCSSIDEKRML